MTEKDDQELLAGRRVASRARVALPATLETVNGTVRAVIRNISETGAMLEVAALPTVGGCAVVRCGSLDAFGVVAWARSRWCGVAFDEPVGHAEVVRMRAASDQGQATTASRRDLEDAAKRWAEGKR